MGNFDISASGWNHIEMVAAKQVGNVLDDVKDDALRTVPRDSNELANSIEKHHEPGALEGTVSVGTDHWAPTEYGSRPHIIRIRTKKVLSDGAKFYGKVVNHPGTPEHSFMRKSTYKRRILRKGI